MEKNKLDNGITLLSERRNSDSIAIEVSVGIGSINEPTDLAGVSHYIEHLLFEGTKKRPAAFTISVEIESVGGEINAETSTEFTSYFIKIPKKHFALAVDVLSDIVINPLFKKEDVERERKIILDEINLIYDNPRFYQILLFNRALFPDHPLSNLPIGTSDTVSAMSRDDICKFFEKHYVSGNITVSVVGDVGDTQEVIKQAFSDMKAGNSNTTLKPVKSTSGFHAVADRQMGQSYMILGYNTVARSEAQSYHLDIAQAIIGRGMSGWLMDELRTKRGLAYDVGAEHNAGVNYGIFASHVSTQKENLAESEKIIAKCNERIKSVSETEIKSAKDYIEGSFLLQNEDTLRRASTLRYLNNAAGLKTPEDYIKKIQKVTLDDVKATAEEYLTEDYVLSTLKQK